MGVLMYLECVLCGVVAHLSFEDAQRLGWYWERRVGIKYDYYCPECARKGK